MLREQVLWEWNNCREKIKKERNISDFIADKICGEGVLPNIQIFDLTSDLKALEQKLDYWTKPQYQARVEAEKEVVAKQAKELENIITTSWHLAYLNSHALFANLALGWWQEKDNNSSGPTIEEID